jgi:hypothetical protein
MAQPGKLQYCLKPSTKLSQKGTTQPRSRASNILAVISARRISRQSPFPNFLDNLPDGYKAEP